jgi:hypothetical protein
MERLRTTCAGGDLVDHDRHLVAFLPPRLIEGSDGPTVLCLSCGTLARGVRPRPGGLVLRVAGTAVQVLLQRPHPGLVAMARAVLDSIIIEAGDGISIDVGGLASLRSWLAEPSDGAEGAA